MIILTKYRDNTYTWLLEFELLGPYSKAYAISYGLWFLKLNRFQIDTGMEFLSDKMGYDIVVYKNKVFHEVKKVDYTDMGKK